MVMQVELFDYPFGHLLHIDTHQLDVAVVLVTQEVHEFFGKLDPEIKC